MFNQQEIATLVGGTDEPVDVEDLRRNTVRLPSLPSFFPSSFTDCSRLSRLTGLRRLAR
jgi:hypothetical protein